MGRGKLVLLVIVLVAATIFAVVAKGKADRRKKGAQILDAYVTATGGAPAYAAIRTLVIRGKGTLNSEPMVTTEYRATGPCRYFGTMSTESTEFIQGSDGKVAWMIKDRKPDVLVGANRLDMLRRAALDSDVRWRDFFTSAEYAGTATFEGRPCHKVILTPREGNPRTRYYDTTSSLLIGEETLIPVTGSVPQAAVTTCDNYRKYGGILLPTSQTARVGTFQVSATVEDVAINQELDDELFKQPKAVEIMLVALPGYLRNAAGQR